MDLWKNMAAKIFGQGRGYLVAQLCFWSLIFFVIMPLGLASCTSDVSGLGSDVPPTSTTPTPPPPGSPPDTSIPVITAPAEGVVGPEGGTVAHVSGAKIIVPPGALASPTRLTIVGIAPPSEMVLGGTPLGQGFELGPEGQTFSKPVEIVIPFDPTRVPVGMNATSSQAYMAPRGSTSFTPLFSVVDLDTRTIRTTTVHFTQFVPAQNPNPVTITTPSPLPNALVEQSYSQQLDASGGAAPYTWSVASGSVLPPSLTINPTSGLLSGVPAVPNNYGFFIVARDAAGRAVQKAFALTVGVAQNPSPALSSITPSTIPEGTGTTTITLTGTGFVPSSSATWDGSPLATTYVSGATLAAAIPSASLTVGSHQVAVSTPAPGGGTSANVAFVVTALPDPNPIPIVTAVDPTSVLVSAVDTQVTITGSQFLATTSASIGAQGISTTFVSATQLIATIPSSYLAAPTTLQIGAYTPPPGGGFSAATVAVTVGSNNPVPTLSAISPSSAMEGSASFTMSLTGTNFVSGGQVSFNATVLATTVTSATTATATVPASVIATSGVASVRFINPTPGGGSSAAQNFTITSSSGGGGCPSGYADLDENPANGCETNITGQIACITWYGSFTDCSTTTVADSAGFYPVTGKYMAALSPGSSIYVECQDPQNGLTTGHAGLRAIVNNTNPELAFYVWDQSQDATAGQQTCAELVNAPHVHYRGYALPNMAPIVRSGSNAIELQGILSAVRSSVCTQPVVVPRWRVRCAGKSGN